MFKIFVLPKSINENFKYLVGYYCDMADEPVTDYMPYPCPIGHYCINGTRFSTEYPCPSGTYGPIERLQAEDECYPCDAGKLAGKNFCIKMNCVSFDNIK